MRPGERCPPRHPRGARARPPNHLQSLTSALWDPQVHPELCPTQRPGSRTGSGGGASVPSPRKRPRRPRSLGSSLLRPLPAPPVPAGSPEPRVPTLFQRPAGTWSLPAPSRIRTPTPRHRVLGPPSPRAPPAPPGDTGAPPRRGTHFPPPPPSAPRAPSSPRSASDASGSVPGWGRGQRHPRGLRPCAPGPAPPDLWRRRSRPALGVDLRAAVRKSPAPGTVPASLGTPKA